jgi:hypothetical protein
MHEVMYRHFKSTSDKVIIKFYTIYNANNFQILSSIILILSYI